MGGKSSGGGPSGSTTTTQNTAPWTGQQPYLSGGVQASTPQYFSGAGQHADITQGTPGIFGNAANLYENYTPQYFADSTVSPFTNPQSSALGTLSNPALANSVANPATNYSNTLLNGGFLANNPATPTLNQYANGSMLNSMQPAITAAVQQATPGLLDSFTGGNRLNSPAAAQSVATGQASAAAPYLAAEQGQQIGAANTLGTNFNTGVTAMNQGLAFAPQTAGLPYAGANQQLQAGGTQQQQNQAQLNDQINRWNFQQQLPYNQLATYQQMVNGNYGGSGTLTQPYFSQPGKSTGQAVGQGVMTALPLIAALAF